ncbi:DUF7287 family protein [Halorientalis marina]|jgi:hypothetical protein|uniref:DUF7287 family protein n=1 Tax=Halorientalis marina TaxID=2931976 RepID=UPI001FF68A2B|nr:hypothetical protein [Halorientalis marina]
MTRDRGQTTQDYILGVSIMLATVLFVFGFLPGVFESYESSVDGIDQEQAERASEYIVAEYSVPGKQNILRNETGGSSDDLYSNLSTDFERFRQRAGLNTQTERQAKPNVNVAVVNASEFTLEGDSDIREPVYFEGRGFYEFGDDYDNQSAATRTRVVTFSEDPSSECSPACYLVVRVW